MSDFVEETFRCLRLANYSTIVRIWNCSAEWIKCFVYAHSNPNSNPHSIPHSNPNSNPHSIPHFNPHSIPHFISHSIAHSNPYSIHHFIPDSTSLHFNTEVLFSGTLAPMWGESWRHPCTWRHHRIEIIQKSNSRENLSIFFNAYVRKCAINTPYWRHHGKFPMVRWTALIEANFAWNLVPRVFFTPLWPCWQRIKNICSLQAQEHNVSPT